MRFPVGKCAWNCHSKCKLAVTFSPQKTNGHVNPNDGGFFAHFWKNWTMYTYIYIYIYIYISCWQFEDTGNGKEHEMFIHIYGRNYSSWVPKRDPCQNVCWFSCFPGQVHSNHHFHYTMVRFPSFPAWGCDIIQPPTRNTILTPTWIVSGWQPWSLTHVWICLHGS